MQEKHLREKEFTKEQIIAQLKALGINPAMALWCIQLFQQLEKSRAGQIG